MSNWMHRQIMSEARACDKINRTEKNKQARCDVSKQDHAARIARRIVNRVAVGVDWPSDTERAIRRAITAAVRKERERCVVIVQKECNTDIAWVGRTTVCKSIVNAIRKGKA